MALVATLTGVSRSTLRAAAQAGHLQARRISPGPRGQWVMTLTAVDAWLKGARHRPGRSPRRRTPEVSAPEHQAPTEPAT